MPAVKFPRDALGVGLRAEFYRDVHAAAELQRTEQKSGGNGDTPPLLPDFFEIILENYLGRSSVARDNLRAIAARVPLVGHGVSLNLLGADPLDLVYLRQVKELVTEFQLLYVSDHLCWTAHQGVTHHDLLPVPYARELVAYAAERAAYVQDYLGVPFGIENLSSYVSFKRDEMPEWEFYAEVVRQSGCWYMLDLNNIQVSSVNHGFDPLHYLHSVDWTKLLQVHIAGHLVRPDGLLHDTHDHDVSDAVWALYQAAWQLGGPFPTLLERDADIPPFADVLAELQRAKVLRAACLSQRASQSGTASAASHIAEPRGRR